ncbi:alpha/beta hydrolase [Cyanosarcina cf. burmensis CCALA 770]|nr:alpha/beta hydrolase [Cyanosarcina cf. burmensis CCALA 770]
MNDKGAEEQFKIQNSKFKIQNSKFPDSRLPSTGAQQCAPTDSRFSTTTPIVSNRPCFLSPKKLQPEYPLFVFLPGMDGTGQLLRSQTEGLEVAFDVRCLMIPPDDMTSWDVLSAQVIQLIHKELAKNPQREVYLCGESFGGCLAMKVAVKAPELFSRIILVNPASSVQLRPFLAWGSQFANLVPSCFYQFGAVGLLPFLASLGRVTKSDRREMLKVIRSVPPETVLWRIALIKNFDVDKTQLRQLTQPVLLIASAQDRLLPSIAEAERLLGILPNSRLVVLPYSGHACLLESETNLYDIMRSQHFLDANTAKMAAGRF